MFYGHPVERLCTYQYSLISLIPGLFILLYVVLLLLIYVSGLLQTLDDCGSPPLAARAPTLSRPTSLRTSDHKSMMAYIGLPLDIFGKVGTLKRLYPHISIVTLGRILSTLSAVTAA
jgi:Transport protein Avl9